MGITLFKTLTIIHIKFFNLIVAYTLIIYSLNVSYKIQQTFQYILSIFKSQFSFSSILLFFYHNLAKRGELR